MYLKEETTGRMYDIWSWFYDKTFGMLIRKRQRRAIQQLRAEPGDRVLDLGVGTGLTLRHYPEGVTVVGMDLSAGMLGKAADKIEQHKLTDTHLVQGDAMTPPFAEGSFDHVLITHVITVVSDPPLLLEWARRLVKPGGRIVVLNHFQSDKPFFAWIEKMLNPIFVKIGWKSDLAMEDVLDGSGLRVEYVFKMSLVDMWRIVVLTKPGGKDEASRDAEPTGARDDAMPDAPLAMD